jgi:CelD/BcsL family acetyltransferase involved in cellulose biosynthesis
VTADPGTGALRVEFVTDIAQLPALAAKWEALNVGRDHDAPFFQSYVWNMHVARVRTMARGTRFKLLVATVWEGDDLVGLWPLSLQRSHGARVACSLDDPFGQFAGVVFGREEHIAPGVAAIVEALRGRADGLQIEAVVAGSHLHATLLQAGAQPVAFQDSVRVDLRPFPSFDAFLKTVNSKTRMNLRNRRNRLESLHRVEHVVAESPETLEPLLRQTFESRVSWLQRNGRTSPAFRVPEFKTLIEQLPRTEGIGLIGFAFNADSICMSSHFGFEYRGKYYAYMSAMDPAFEQFNPGRMHLGLLIESGFKRGLEGVELMPPAVRYKTEWSHDTKRIETMSLAFTTRGRLALDVAGWVIPKIRSLSRMLPERVRKALVARVNRQ